MPSKLPLGLTPARKVRALSIDADLDKQQVLFGPTFGQAEAAVMLTAFRASGPQKLKPRGFSEAAQAILLSARAIDAGPADLDSCLSRMQRANSLTSVWMLIGQDWKRDFLRHLCNVLSRPFYLLCESPC